MKKNRVFGLVMVLVGMLLTIAAHGEEYPFKVYNPSDLYPKGSLLEGKPRIDENVKVLLDHLKDPKDQEFITTRRGGDMPLSDLKWPFS